MDMTPPRREGDQEEIDYRTQRRQITGDEVQVGLGKYTMTLKGSMVIGVVAALAILGLLGFLANEQTKSTNALSALISTTNQVVSREHRDGNQTLRLQTCVLSMTPEERIQWRTSRDAQNALYAYCPGLLMLPATP